jgi:hypothetical protein
MRPIQLDFLLGSIAHSGPVLKTHWHIRFNPVLSRNPVG